MNRSRPRDSARRSRNEPAAALDCFGLTDCGRVRPKNEDAFFVDPDKGMFIVSDGMGGRNAGSLASEIVVEVLPLLIREHLNGIESLVGAAARHRLKAAVAKLSADVRSRTRGQPGLQGMGATVVLALVWGSNALIAHLGDSRLYRYRKESLKLLTKDHSLAQMLVERGEITAAEARDHPAKSQLTQFIGMQGEPKVEVRAVELLSGDRFLFCSDGLTNMVSDAELADILRQGMQSQEVCRQLVAAANKAGGKDNITVVHLAVRVG